MIKKVLHKNIDREKYSECLQNSENYRIYAEDWYLDIVSEKRWDCYVYGDYEAVMPIPYVRKFGIKIIAQPLFCQQLGVFSPKNELIKVQDFYLKMKKNLVKSYHFNSGNFFVKDILKIQSKTNQIFFMEEDYEKSKKKYNRLRKRNIRKFNEHHFTIQEKFLPEKMIEDFSYEFPKIEFKERNRQVLKNLMKICIDKNIGFQRNAVKDNKVFTTGFWAFSKDRIYYIFSSNSAIGKEFGATTALVDSVIKDFNNLKIYDFEGSSLQKINEFNKSFGAETEIYFLYKNV